MTNIIQEDTRHANSHAQTQAWGVLCDNLDIFAWSGHSTHEYDAWFDESQRVEKGHVKADRSGCAYLLFVHKLGRLGG